MPLGSFRINSISKRFTVAVAAEVIRAKKGIRALGDAKISTAQSQFGGSSAVFDGTDDHLLASTVASDSSGEFTVEAWCRFNILPTSQTLGGGSYMMLATHNSSNYFLIRNNEVQIAHAGGFFTIATATVTTNTWYHYAFVRDSSNVWSVYLNGVKYTNNDSRTGNWLGSQLIIGKFTDSRGSWNGFIDEFRVSNVARYTANFTPSTTPFVNDANTLLLLHMDGTNNSTVFEDDNGVSVPTIVTNAVTSFGSPVISTAQSKFGGSSLLLAGNQSLQSKQPFTVDGNSGNVTIEGWFRRTSGSGNATVVNLLSAKNVRWAFYWRGNNKFGVFNATSGVVVESTTTLSQNTWYHFAFVKQGTSTRLYINGTQEATVTNTVGVDVEIIEIGAFDTSGESFVGNIDEVRISNTARYSSNFSVATSPFTVDSDTQALFHFDGANNSTNFSVEPTRSYTDNRQKAGVVGFNGAKISTAQSKFGGSSLLLNGSNEWLNASTKNLGAYSDDDWTLECWFYKTSGLTSNGTLVNISSIVPVPSFQTRWAFFTRANSKVGLFNTVSGTFAETTTSIALNTWYHIAYVKQGNTWKIFLNGQLEATVTNNVSITGSICQVGAFNSGSDAFPGYIDEVRISNTARYTENFTPPTQPHVNDANTLLLLHMDGTNNSTYFEDDNGVRAKKGIAAIGDAKISTAQSKFGGSSAVFDGSGDWLTTPFSPDYNLNNTSDWTVEFWTRRNTLGFEGFIGSQQLNTQSGWMINATPTGGLNWIHGTSVVSVSAGLQTNTWYHIAVVRENTTTLRIFVNGVRLLNNTSYNGSTTQSNEFLRIGGGRGISTNWVGDNSINGFMDEVRISNTARYTENFTPATEPFQNDSNTLLLLHMDGTNNSTVFTDDNGVPPDWDYS